MSGLEIVSVGMVTAVGLDAPSACAAMRARLDGFQETTFRAGNEPLVGAPVVLPRVWIGERRMAGMAAAAMIEALRGVTDGRIGLILCLPEPGRAGSAVRNSDRLLARILAATGFQAHGEPKVVAHGRPSGHVALDLARRILRADECDSVLVAGVDTYLTGNSIEYYLNERRLLTPNNPNGFVPGEAAAAILCRKPRTAGFGLFGLGLTREPSPIYASDIPFRGDGMTAAYRAALGETGIDMNRLGYRISDLIGEQYWFKQAALASLRLLRGRHEFQDIWSPAESVGNVGAAVVPMMIAQAWTAARKGYAAGNPVLIESSNDQGACAAAVFGMGERH